MKVQQILVAHSHKVPVDWLLEPPTLKRKSWSETQNEIRVDYVSIYGVVPRVDEYSGAIFLRILSIGTSSATVQLEVNSLGSPESTQFGACWNIFGSPTTSNDKTTEGTPSLNIFSSELTGLSESTTYYVRAYITNSNGTFYSNQISFTTEEAEFSALTEGLISYWKLDETSGIVGVDSQGLANITFVNTDDSNWQSPGIQLNRSDEDGVVNHDYDEVFNGDSAFSAWIVF